MERKLIFLSYSIKVDGELTREHNRFCPKSDDYVFVSWCPRGHKLAIRKNKKESESTKSRNGKEIKFCFIKHQS